jgi:hypothetical protein
VLQIVRVITLDHYRRAMSKRPETISLCEFYKVVVTFSMSTANGRTVCSCREFLRPVLDGRLH